MTYKFKLSRRLAASHTGRTLSLALLLGTLTACGASSPTGPDTGEGPPVAVPGWLTVQLTTPHSDDGALQLRISGPSIDSVAPTAAFDGFGSVNSGGADVVITGNVADGNIARFRVADVNRASGYSVSVVAAAQLSTWELRGDTGEYRTVIVR